jgi:hypothetical protein
MLPMVGVQKLDKVAETANLHGTQIAIMTRSVFLTTKEADKCGLLAGKTRDRVCCQSPLTKVGRPDNLLPSANLRKS